MINRATKCDGKVLELTMAASEGHNLVDDATLADLASALAEAEASERVVVALLRSEGRHFAVGANLRELQAKDGQALLNDPRRGHWRQVASFAKPLVVAVQGMALGAGNELAMHGDIILCADNASFGQPEIKLGLIPGAGGSQRLPRLVGKARAAHMLLTGEAISAAQAHAAGLVSVLCKPELLQEEGMAVAGRLAGLPPLALQAAKRSMRAAFEMPLAEGLDFEYGQYAGLAGTQDRNEGIQAFLERRKPRYEGK